MDIERCGGGCGCDYFKIKDGEGYLQRMRKICGSRVPNEWRSRTNEVTITFKSDSSVTGLGFKATYEVVDARPTPTSK